MAHSSRSSFPRLGLSPIAFAMVATAAMLAGTFHAPLFGAMMILEMTNNYLFLVPILLGGWHRVCAGAALPARFGLHFCAAGRGHSPEARHLHRRSPAGMKPVDGNRVPNSYTFVVEIRS